MPRIRCKFYTESGEPVRNGCHRKGAGCNFVHPNDPGWNDAPPPSFRRDRGGDTGGFKSWGGKHDNGWATDRNASTGAGSAWGSGEGWGNWGAEASGSTSNQPAPSNNSSTTTWGDANNGTSSGWGTGNDGWGSSWGNGNANKDTDKTTHGGDADNGTSSGWGNDGWGGSWENDNTNKDADKATESGWGNGWDWGKPNDTDKTAESDSGNKDANKGAGSGWGSGWGAGVWGSNEDTTNSSAAPVPMVVDSQAEKEAGRDKGKRRAVPAPPRIRIPDNEPKKDKISGTNNEPMGPSRWGEPRSANLVTSSTPVATATPVTTLTPTDSSRLKRKRDAAHDDKFDVFKEYIKAWERGVRTRFLLAEAETKRDRWFRTQKSACYARVGEAGRKRLDGERAECDKEVNLQRDKLSSAISSLVDFHDTFSSNLDLGQHYNIGEEAKNFIDESRAFVDQVRTLLVERVLKEKNDAQSGDAQKHPLVEPASVESLRSQVRDLEERFEQAQTELTLRHHRDIRTEINDLLTDRIDALRRARQREIDRVASQPRPEIIIPPSALLKIEGTERCISELGAKIPQTVEDIRRLLLRVDATTKRVSELEQELSVNKATYNKQVQEMAAQTQETQRRIDERLEKIRGQFEQLVASRPPDPTEQPAMSPTVCNSRDKLMDSLRPAFEVHLEQFYAQKVIPAIDALQRVVIQASDRHQEEAIKVLWGKIQPAMNMVAGVSRWLDSQELSITAPAGI